MEDQDNYPLDDAAIESLMAYDAEIAKLQAAQSGMLQYFLKLHKLTGPWRIAENKRELVRIREQVQTT